MRICSMFSTATELLYALGLGRSVVGRSHQCDYPPAARRKPVVVQSRIASERLSSAEIDGAVQRMRERGEHQYLIDQPLLKRLHPDLVVTQELCSVCAASHPEVLEAIATLPRHPQAVSISVRSFGELYAAILNLGKATERERAAIRLVERIKREVEAIQQRLAGAKPRPRVWCAEWLEPLMAAGHWIPDLVEMAGGHDGLGQSSHDSRRLSWEEVQAYDPEVIIVMPCSFTMARTFQERRLLTDRPGWSNVRAVKRGRVFAVETAPFHRTGPRLVTGLKILAGLLHPERFPKPSPAHARPLI